MNLNNFLEIATYITSILGIPLALFLFWNEKRKETLEREYGTYNALDEKYIDYLKLCIEYPECNLYYLPLRKPTKLTEEQKIKQYALFEILLTLMERAFLMYSNQSNKIKKQQWEGWDSFIRDWCKRKDFIELYNELGNQFDSEFGKYIKGIFTQA